MTRINVRVDEAIKRELEIEAEERGTSPSALVREIIEAYFQRRDSSENAFDVAQRLGLFGSAKGLPADLSTNPIYREGFGGEETDLDRHDSAGRDLLRG